MPKLIAEVAPRVAFQGNSRLSDCRHGSIGYLRIYVFP